MDEPNISDTCEFEVKLEGADLVYHRTGYYGVESDYGWVMFIRPELCFRHTPEWRWRVSDFPTKASILEIFKKGMVDGVMMAGRVEALGMEFSEEYFWKLYKAGFRVQWKMHSGSEKKPGGEVGPGVAVCLVRITNKDGREIVSLDVESRHRQRRTSKSRAT